MIWFWIREAVRYTIVVLAALVTATLFVGYLAPKGGALAPAERSVDRSVSTPRLRAECDKQFYSTTTPARHLEPGTEDELLVSYASPVGYPGATPVEGPGYVLLRMQPQFGAAAPDGQASVVDTSATKDEMSWDDVTVTVARYVDPLRNEAVCSQTAVRFHEDKFESYCEIPNASMPQEEGQASYRIFVRNESGVPVEYCIVSNCTASAPYGQGTICPYEQLRDQPASSPSALLPTHPTGPTDNAPREQPPQRQQPNASQPSPEPPAATTPPKRPATPPPKAPAAVRPKAPAPQPDPADATKPQLPEVDQAAPATR